MGYVVFILSLLGNKIAISMKSNALIKLAPVVLLWLLFSGNNYNPDYSNYNRWFNTAQNSVEGKDIGYKALMNFIGRFGLDYTGFIIIVSIIGFFLIHSTIRKYSPIPNYIYILYAFYPFLLDVVQVRNFFMMSIIIFSVRYLVEDIKYSKFKFTVCVLIAFSIHTAAILYIPFVLINKKSNLVIRLLVLFVFLYSIIIFFNNNQIPYIYDILGVIDDNQHIVRWFERRTNFGFILFLGMHMLTYLLLYFSKHSISRYYDINPSHLTFVKITYWITVVGFLWLPFYMVSIEFTRLMRNLFILNYISLSITNYYLTLYKNRFMYFYRIICLIYVILFFFLQIYQPHLDTVIRPIFENNHLW